MQLYKELASPKDNYIGYRYYIIILFVWSGTPCPLKTYFVLLHSGGTTILLSSAASRPNLFQAQRGAHVNLGLSQSFLQMWSLRPQHYLLPKISHCSVRFPVVPLLGNLRKHSVWKCCLAQLPSIMGDATPHGGVFPSGWRPIRPPRWVMEDEVPMKRETHGAENCLLPTKATPELKRQHHIPDDCTLHMYRTKVCRVSFI